LKPRDWAAGWRHVVRAGESILIALGIAFSGVRATGPYDPGLSVADP